MGTATQFQYTKLAPLDETFELQGDDIVWRRTWVAPTGQTAVQTAEKLAAADPRITEAQAEVKEPPTASDLPVAGEPELGEFLAFEEPPPPEQPANSEDDKVAEDDEAAGRLAWDKASDRIRSPLLRLHSEIVNFCRALSPTAEEVAARHEAIARVTTQVCHIWPTAQVKVFGSVLTGLFVPSSDVDVVVMNAQYGKGSGAVKQALYKLSAALRKHGAAHNIQVIAKAKVPIIKFTETASSFAFDVSFDVADGPVAGEYVAELMAELPPMKPLVLVLKIFLQQRDFNEVYKGGIGSYGLITMVAAFLLLSPSRWVQTSSRAQAEQACNLGELLVDFFRLFGRTLNTTVVGVSCRNGGEFFAKLDRPDPFYQELRPGMLAIEDPRDPENDLGKGSFNYERLIRPAMDFAYQQLSAPSKADESILARIVRQDTILLGRQLAPPTEPQHPAPAAARPQEAPKSQSSHHPSSHKRRGPERERERDRAFKHPRGEEGQYAGAERWQPGSPHSGTASHGPRQNSHNGAQASGGRQNGYQHAGTAPPQQSAREHKKHRRRSRDRGTEHGMPMGVVDRQFEGKKGRRPHSRHKQGRQQ